MYFAIREVIKTSPFVVITLDTLPNASPRFIIPAWDYILLISVAQKYNNLMDKISFCLTITEKDC